MKLTTFTLLLPFIGVAMFLHSRLDAQEPTFSTPQPQTGCTTCPTGPRGPAGRDGVDGRNGRDGKDGKDGRDGRDVPQGPRTLRPFDVGFHGLNFAVRHVVRDGTATFLLVYEPSLRVAALIDTATCYAQVEPNFTAGLTGDPRGAIVFDDVLALTPRSFGWWHHGAMWSHDWNEGLPIIDLQQVKGIDTRTGQLTAVCRFR